MTNFLGIRGTGDWEDNQRPEEWKESILFLEPNGQAPLTALLSKMSKEVVTDPKYHWWTETLSAQSGTITGIYTDSGLSISYTSGGTAGAFLYAKMSAADLTEFREGHQVILRDASDLDVDVVGKVVDRVEGGASSYVKVKLLEDDDNSSTHDLSDADTLLVSGNINAEGAGMPDAISYNPVEWFNYTQIFRTPLEITGTAKVTKLRTNPQAYQKLKMQSLKYHMLEMEKAFLFGIPTSGIGDNGKPERTTLGLIPAIRGGYAGHGGTAGTVSNYATESNWSGMSWLAGGEDWLDTQLEIIFRYGAEEKLALCGSGALMAINKLVKAGGDFAFGPTVSVYGIKIRELITAVGSIYLLTHPLFSLDITMRYTMAIFEPKNLVYRPLTDRDTTFFGEKDDQNTGYTRRDGTKEEYLTEAGLEYYHPVSWGFLSGFNSTNTAS